MKMGFQLKSPTIRCQKVSIIGLISSLERGQDSRVTRLMALQTTMLVFPREGLLMSAISGFCQGSQLPV